MNTKIVESPISDDGRPWEAFGPTWIEVDLDVLEANLAAVAAYVRRPRPEEAVRFIERHGLRRPDGPPRLLVVVKADGYGHGAVEAAQAALRAGADMLGVATVLEGLELRHAGVEAPVLVFNPLTPAEAGTVVRAGLTPTVTSPEAVRALAGAVQEAAAGPAAGGFPVHISVDCGMSRWGVQPEKAAEMARLVVGAGVLLVEGLYTHFPAGAERGPARVALMRSQLETFAGAVAAVEAEGVEIPLRHAACSSAIVALPESHLDMVRVGNLFYGFLPRADGLGGRVSGDGDTRGLPEVREAWSFVTRVLEVREVPAGTGVGYGPDVTVRRRTRLATVPVGYADGVGAEVMAGAGRLRTRLVRLLRVVLRWLDRRGLLVGPLAGLRAQAEALSLFFHEGRPVETVGRISMQQTVLDVTDRPEIKVGSVVHVQAKRVLASPRLGRVYYSGGRAVRARITAGMAEAALAVAL